VLFFEVRKLFIFLGLVILDHILQDCKL